MTRILVIEDDSQYAAMIREFLTRDNSFGVDCETTLSSALTRLGFQKFDVVLLDLNLPDSKGFETFTRVVAAVPKTPVIILSGECLEEDVAVQAVECGAQEYLMKGELDLKTLVRTLRHAIARKAMQEDLKATNQALEEKMKELDRLNQVMMGREERILELKEELQKLQQVREGQPRRKEVA